MQESQDIRQPLQFTVTSTTANRELEGNITSFLALLGKNKFRRMIDPFCGSGSFSCHAMHRNLATEYIINDAYSPIIALLQAISHDHDKLKAAYEEFYKNPATFFSPENYQAYIEELTQNDIPVYRRAALWLFLANRLANNRPLFFRGKLISQINEQSVISNFNTALKIDAMHALFSNYKPTFSNLNAMGLLHQLKLNNEDLVILDPPYPGFADLEQTIFFRPENDEKLYQSLIEIIQLLNANRVTFILAYDLFYGQEKPHSMKYQIDEKHLPIQHLLLVSRNPSDPEFDTLFEHVYVSTNVLLDMNYLPKGFFSYESIKNYSYDDAKQLIASRNYIL